MRKTGTAKRLAKALLEVGREENAYREFGEELKAMAEVFRKNPELMGVLLNPMYKLEQRLDLVEKVSQGADLKPQVARFLRILVESRSINLIQEIAAAYSDLEDEIAGRIRAQVESPFEVGEDSLQAIKAQLSKATGKEVVLGYKKNPALIGGIVIRMDNTILDGSLKTQLELMKEKILEGVV